MTATARHDAVTPIARSLVGGVVLAALLLDGCARGENAFPNNSSAAAEPDPGLSTAPQDARVDLAEPTFSNPTAITNPLFPISALTQVIQLGTEAGVRLRNEVTLLPRTKTVAWNGRDVQTLVSQSVGYRDGRIREVTYDYYAQADDGSVWYFGEDVENYEGGVIADYRGTWLAGQHGPPGMIMPAKPAVGDVYRPENIPGAVFEEVTVKSVGERVAGPRGPVDNALLVQELLLDGTLEDKVFVPAYGEFRAEVVAEDELVTVSVAAPVDSIPGDVPENLRVLSRGAVDILAAVPEQDWPRLSAVRADLTTAWDGYRTGSVPPLIHEQMSAALDELGAAVNAQEPERVLAAATEAANAALDLELRHRPPAQVDVGRLELRTRQLLADAAAAEVASVAGDTATLQTIWDRTVHTVDTPIRARIDAGLADLRTATAAADLDSVALIGGELQVTLTEVIAAGG